MFTIMVIEIPSGIQGGTRQGHPGLITWTQGEEKLPWERSFETDTFDQRNADCVVRNTFIFQEDELSNSSLGSVLGHSQSHCIWGPAVLLLTGNQSHFSLMVWLSAVLCLSHLSICKKFSGAWDEERFSIYEYVQLCFQDRLFPCPTAPNVGQQPECYTKFFYLSSLLLY